MSGIYFHIPFCRKACTYCDFHFSTSLKNKKELLNAMIQEMKIRKDYLSNDTIQSVYFGGGTPSVLEQDELLLLLEQLNKNFSVDEKAEITLEANPDDMSIEKLNALHKTGINRLSIGLQSFIQEELVWMNRSHSVEDNLNCVKRAQDAGFGNITVDLIYGSKFQSLFSWEAALNTVSSLNIDHLSCYNLTAEEKTIFGHRVNKKQEPEVSEELSASQFDLLMDWASANQFEHYEISNFARNEKYAVHNSSYWLGKKYLGLGPSAHSYNGISRQINVSNNTVYIKKISENECFSETELLDKNTKFNEYLLTRLRTKWGLDTDFLQNEFSDFMPNVQPLINEEVSAGNMEIKGNNLILTRKGKYFADGIAQKFFIV